MKKQYQMRQHENGFYSAWIIDENGMIESATSCSTAQECHKFLFDNGATRLEEIDLIYKTEKY